MNTVYYLYNNIYLLINQVELTLNPHLKEPYKGDLPISH